MLWESRSGASPAGATPSDTDRPVPPSTLERLAGVRGAGAAAEGLVQLVVDGMGDLVELTIDPGAMRLTAPALANAVREAFAAAREQAATQLRAAAQDRGPGLGAAGNGVDGRALADLADLGFAAQRRLGELTAIASDLAALASRNSSRPR